MGNHLDGLPQKEALAFLLDDPEIDLSGRVVGVPVEDSAGEPLVVSEVQIGFAAVIEHVDFAVLVGAHRSGIDVDVGIEFLHPNPQTTGF